MTDLHAKERNDPESGGLVIDLIEDETLVGIVYREDESLLAEFYPDDDGNLWAFDISDLQKVLDMAAAMLGSGEEAAPVPMGEAGQHPVDTLAMHFDSMVIRRGIEDEGFYPLPVAVAILGRCAELGLAMVFIEGVTVHADGVDPVSGHKADLGETNAGGPFALFQAECNTQAGALLERWPRQRPDFGVAIEVQDAEGERFVL
jgi:hypothetical protein